MKTQSLTKEQAQELADELLKYYGVKAKKPSTKLTKEQKLVLCRGCRDNFYNGFNDIGVKECWHLKSAKLVKKKKVPLDQRPPWKQEAIEVLSCRNEAGCIFVEKNQEY